MAEIDTLIVRNLKEIDAAASRLRYGIEEQIGRELNDFIEGWAEKNGWKGVFDWYGDEDYIWVAAPEWRGKNNEDEYDYDFWFELDAGQGEIMKDDPAGDVFWLTKLCATGRGTLGFRSAQDSDQFLKGRKWKAKIEPLVQGLVKLGLVYEDKSGQFFLPIAVDQERLAVSIENEVVSEALEPIAIALNRLIKAEPIIDQIRTIARTVDN